MLPRFRFFLLYLLFFFYSGWSAIFLLIIGLSGVFLWPRFLWRLFIFLLHSLIADVLRTREGQRQNHTFFCSLTSCVARNERNDSGSNDDIECVKIFLFSYTHFLRIEERPILLGALGYAWASFETVPGRNPPIFQTNLLWITSLGTTYILRTETTDAVT